jgi:hypothetical protein
MDTNPPGATGHPARHRGRTGWRRFALIFTPALLALLLLALGAATGVVPVALAMDGQQGVKVTMTSFYTDGTATFPSFFDTAAGEHRTVLPVTLRNLRVQGVCVSTKVDTPVGDYVLRITSPRDGGVIQVGDTTMAVDNIDSLDFGGDTVGVNYGARTADGTRTDTGLPGSVPIQVNGAKLGLNLTIRWLTANQIHLSGLALAGGLNQHECY